jgi:tRNA (guanine37-N1)-methyltransferase|tara:strand:- start:222 stop:905 length:684 start_codon:yes stop_codon:yes gene_type:complete
MNIRKKYDILSLFPEMISGFCSNSMLGNAQKKQILQIHLHNLRDWTSGPHFTADDRPFGGGAGMVIKPEPVFSAVEELAGNDTEVLYMSPDGQPLTSSLAKKLAHKDHLLFISGHYEGIDQRIRDHLVDREISIGDYVLTNGTLAAAVAVDSISRFIPGVLGDDKSLMNESFTNNLLSHPQYTRPAVYRDLEVPKVLLSGNHKKIEEWREENRISKTRTLRPDLIEN